MVIVGFFVGGLFNVKGSVIIILCLFYDLDVVFVGVFFSLYYGVLYGFEYEFGFKNIVYNDDVLCVVCYDIYVFIFVMIFGKIFCFSYWIIQFDGFLILDVYYFGYFGVEYLCMDSNLEYVIEGVRQ